MEKKLFEFSISKTRLILAFCGIIAVLALYFGIRTSIKYTLCMIFLLALGGLFGLRVRGRFSFLLWPLAAMGFGAFGIALGQNINGYGPMLPAVQYLMGVEVALVFMLVFYALLSLFVKDVSKCSKTAIIAASMLFLLLNIVNYYTVMLRGKGISPQDFFSIRTAANVVGEYDIKPTTDIINSVSLYAAAVLFLLGLRTDAPRLKPAAKLAPLLLASLLTLHFHSAVKYAEPLFWGDHGTKVNGLILNLAGQLDRSMNKKPEGYSQERVKTLEMEYSAPENTVPQEKMPHIIVIMNECYADMSVWGEFQTDIPVLPVYEGMSENTVKGYMLASIYGGMTPDSEYEFLTGNSIASMGPATVPYVQYMRKDIWSLARYLEGFGYRSFYTHPCAPQNYDRNIAVPSLGFEEIVFEEEYTDSERKRVFVSDGALFDRLIAEYNESKGGGKLFAFAVTMQNHTPFAEKEEFSEPVSLIYPGVLEPLKSVENYLSCIHESDRQLGLLMDYFRNESEPVLILMYGDHQPNLEIDIQADENSYAGEMTKYVVPFAIWTNYDIEEEYVELTSLNFLSNYLLEAAGLPLSPYNQFLQDVQNIVPVMNAYGYLSEEGGFITYDEADGEEKEILQDYEWLQYNAIFDKKNRSEVFFPINQ